MNFEFEAKSFFGFRAYIPHNFYQNIFDKTHTVFNTKNVKDCVNIPKQYGPCIQLWPHDDNSWKNHTV